MPPPATAPETASAALPSSGLPEHSRWFTTEVHPHDGPLKAWLRSSFPSVHDVDDIVQESYIRIWKRRLTGPVTTARSYLYKVARNLALDTLRRTTRSPFQPVPETAEWDVADLAPTAAEAACTSEELGLLLEAIDSLPARCRQVVILRKLHGLSTAEIARQLGMAEGTVHIQGSKGVRRCEAFLRARGVLDRHSP